MQLAPSCFLSSAAASVGLIDLVLPFASRSLSQLLVREAQAQWSRFCPSSDFPPDHAMAFQRTWDDPLVQTSFDSLVESAPVDLSKA